MRTLQACNLRFGYPGKAPLFLDFNVQVQKTERVALKAPSGFGKTTLCKLLAGHLEPEQGAVLLDNEALPRKGRCPVQLIGQHPELAVDPRLRMGTTLKEAGLLDDSLKEKLGIQSKWLKRYPHELSGGELQRFCIARALIAHPVFLIADEISTMLDAITQAQIWQFLIQETQARGIGMVFVSHSAALTKRVATRTIELTA